MRRATPLFLGALLLSTVAAVASSGGGSDSLGDEQQYVVYVGVIRTLNPQTGEIVLLGNREDFPDKELIVKLNADPDVVDVSDISNQAIDLDQVVQGDNVTIDCRIEGDTLVVESIFVYAQKSE